MAVDLFKLQGSVEVNTGKAEADLKRVDVAARRTQSALTQTDSAGKRAGQGITTGFNQSTASASRFSSVLNGLQSKLSSLKAPSLNFGGGAGGGFNVSSLVKGNLITSALSAATGGLTDAMKQGWQAGVEYNKMLEKASISFTTLLGSTDKAQSHLKALQQFGESTPFEFPDLIKASQRMQAMGFAADNVIPSLRAIGDAVSAVGGGKEELDGVVMALGQMQTKGKVSAEEMNQLAERGIPAWDLLAKAIGKTKEETIKLSESGRLNGGRAVQGITAMMGERFGGQMGKMSATLEGRESNFNDILQRQLGAATATNTEQLKAAYEKAAIGLGTTGANAFAVELNKMTGDIGKLVETDLNKLASGETFKRGADTVSQTGKAFSEFKQGNLSGGLSATKGAIEAATGQSLFDWKGIGLQEGNIFTGKKLTLGDLFGGGEEMHAQGKVAGNAIGQGIQDGAKENLQIKSPSKVMMAIGIDAIDGFAIGFESGKRRLGSAVDAEELKKKTVAELEKLREDPRIKAMLDTIAKAEGTGSAYNMKFGGGRFSDLSDHPNDPVTRKMGGKSITSTAAGRYQFLNRTWSGLESQLGLSDFSAKSQDLGAIALMKQRGMIDPILKGDISGALTKGNREWASLPGSPYGQPTKKAEELVTAYNSALEKYNGLMAESSGWMTQLNSLYDAAAAKLSAFSEQVKSFVGVGGSTPAPAPALRVVPQAAQQQPQTIQAGAIAATEVKAKAEVLGLSQDASAAAASIGQMRVATKEIATTSGAASAALQSTESQAGKFADAIMDVGKASEKAIDHMAAFKDAFANGFDNLFDDALDGKALDFKSFGKSLFKGFTSSIISGMTGGKASSPGGMLSQMLFGGLGGGSAAGGGGLGGAVPATGGFAGGGGAADILGKAQGLGSAFKPGGMLSKLPGLGKVGGFLKGLPGIGGALGKIGGFLGFGGGGAAASGAAGAAGGAAGGAGGMLGMAAMFSNPVTAIIGGALMAAPFIAKLFGKDPLSDYKKHIKSEYGVEASKQMAAKVMQIGQSKFGAEWAKRKIETVRLPEVRDMLSEYSGAFMKGSNSKLFDSRMYSDAFSSVNQFKVKMLNGGRVPGQKRGYDHVPVLADGGELVISNDQQRRAQSGGMFGKGRDEIAEMLERLAGALDRFESMPADQVVVTGIAKRPGIAAADVRRSFEVRDDHSVRMREILASR